jgi:phenylacetate-CoA ligase
MFSLISKSLYHPFLELVKKTPIRATLREALVNQHRGIDQLHSLQLAKLQNIVKFAEENCPFYADSFRRANMTAAHLNSLGDIRKFPFVGKMDLAANLSTLRSGKPVGKEFLGSTSGSTGVASVFYYDSLHITWVLASQARGRSWWGLHRGDLELVLWGRPLSDSERTEFKTWLKYRLRNSVQFSTFREFDDKEADRVLQSIRRWRPKLIYGYGSSIARVADYMHRNGLRLSDRERPVIVEFTADTMYPQEIEVATEVFNAPVLSAYGASECGGVAQQCKFGRLHTSVDQALVEFLRPDGSAAEEGETAEIVLSTLNNFAMPLIRYRVGDLGSFSNETCECGLNLPIMTLQAGKAVDLITTSTKTKVSAHTLDYINLYLLKRGIRGVRQYYVEQQSPDGFELSVVRDQQFDPQAVNVFVSKMKELLGSSIEVRTKFVENIPLEPTGKRRYFKKTFTNV